jgi:hypothetical protein
MNAHNISHQHNNVTLGIETQQTRMPMACITIPLRLPAPTLLKQPCSWAGAIASLLALQQRRLKLTRRALSVHYSAAGYCSPPLPSLARTNGPEPAFRYSPLTLPCASAGAPAICLLTLLPGSFDDPVQCRLQVVPLSTTTQYEAISYCWGDPSDVETIMCNSAALTVP